MQHLHRVLDSLPAQQGWLLRRYFGVVGTAASCPQLPKVMGVSQACLNWQLRAALHVCRATYVRLYGEPPFGGSD